MGSGQSLRRCNKVWNLKERPPRAQEIERLPAKVSADKLSAGHQPVHAMTK